MVCLRVYNTLSGKKEVFKPKRDNHVNMYICGPTVYNLLHVGNIRCYVFFDTVRRYLEYKKYSVTMVQNFTDVDDRIIRRSVEENITAQEVADKYVKEALVDYNCMNICKAEHYPRVTEEIQPIIDTISRLIENGSAYESEGHVFFDARKFKDYGKLSKKNVDDLMAGARIEVNEIKRSPVDFVLWKPSKPNEPFWESPWGLGRPGWHIECSAMVNEYLDYVDIHGGGEDLIFPHHENEIAQSEALQEEPLAKYWMHNGMLTIGHKKMSKSLGNFTTLRELAEKFSYDVIRFYLLSGHYRMPLEYGEALIEANQRSLNRIKNCRVLLADAAISAGETLSEAEVGYLEEAKKFRADFEARMDDDFNTADAISVIFELVRFTNRLVNADASTPLSKPCAEGLIALLDELCGILGLDIKTAAGNAGSNQNGPASEEIELLITQRQEARKNKDWALADKIRDDLSARGIIIEDTTTGVKWRTSK